MNSEDERLIKFQHFFNVDKKIKQEMLNIAPDDYIDDNSNLGYSKRMNTTLEYIFTELECVCIDLYGKEHQICKYILEKSKSIMKIFSNCGIDKSKLSLFYEKYITNMNLEFVDCVKEYCVGYSKFDKFEPLKKVTTINELLHFIHSNILNSEDMLQSLPLINEKINDDDYPISLRGYMSQFFEELFNRFPVNLACGWTDIIVINDKTMTMMVRDRGHALTIEITINDNKARIEYFIPKLCNIDMINSLPGINKVNNNSIGATGVFEVPAENLADSLFLFIDSVPTDENMIFKK